MQFTIQTIFSELFRLFSFLFAWMAFSRMYLSLSLSAASPFRSLSHCYSILIRWHNSPLAMAIAAYDFQHLYIIEMIFHTIFRPYAFGIGWCFNRFVSYIRFTKYNTAVNLHRASIQGILALSRFKIFNE